MTLAAQPSAMPTNKLSVGLISQATISLAWSEVFSAWPAISGPGVSQLAGIVIALIIAYFVKDQANVPVSE